MKITSEKILVALSFLLVGLVITWFILSNLVSDYEQVMFVSYILCGVGTVVVLLILLILKRSIYTPLKQLLKTTKGLSQGREIEGELVHGTGVVGEVSTEISKTYENIRKATAFAQDIGEGNFESETEGSEDSDQLTKALLDMRDKLKHVAEEEYKRNWAIQGLATFSELLRNNLSDINELAYNVVKNIVVYLEANQGGFYALHEFNEESELTEEERLFKGKLELLASFAYERRKFKRDEIFVGEGLIGQCVLEKQSIFLTDVPEDHVFITSGLGKATPRCILIVPLILNDVIYGVIEVASFKIIEDYQVKFLEDLGESIASSLASVKMSMNTQKLLDAAEESNLVMKENEEQMGAIQDELNLKLKQIEEDSIKFQSIVEAINKTNAAIEFDTSGKIIDVNDMFLGVMGFKKSELLGQSEAALLPPDEKASPQHAMMWESIKGGQYFSGEFRRVNKAGKDIWMNGTYNPIFNSDGEAIKIIKFASFTTDEKERQLDLNGKLNALKESVGVMELDMSGVIRSVNPLILNALGYKRLETRNKELNLFVGDEYYNSKAFKAIWSAIKDGDNTSHILTFLKKEGGEMHYKANFSSMRNLAGAIVKVLVILMDVTKEVEHEKKLAQELEDALQKSNMIQVADEEKDTEGAMVALNDALEELNKENLSPSSLIESNKLPILMFNAEFKIHDATQILKTLVGVEGEDFKQTDIDTIIDFGSKERREEFEQKVSNAMVFQEEYSIKTPMGAQKMNLIFAPILGDDSTGALNCMITISI